ncbi:MAG: hypothetical protein HYZ42_09295 [Bacteroidetes bacterium]|nr:hypothetical protein [Bacteroidota bacterium]
MSVFYSIVYITIKPIANEQLSIGLFLSDGEKNNFHYSQDKLNLTRRLLSPQAFEMVKQCIDGFSQDINSGAGNFKNSTESYFNYLADYNNNLITFSKPAGIKLAANKEVFKMLFEKFVFTYKEEVVANMVKTTPHSVVKKALYPRIKDRVNINQQLTPKEIPGLLVPKLKVNFIGRNDIPVAGEVIDFEASVSSISNNIGHFTTLINALDGQRGKYFLIGSEPSKQLPEQHSAWSQVKHSRTIQFVPLDEMEEVSDYMVNHHVKPFLIETE